MRKNELDMLKIIGCLTFYLKKKTNLFSTLKTENFLKMIGCKKKKIGTFVLEMCCNGIKTM